MKESIIIISDLHSNGFALKSAIEMIKLKSPDKIIILGDLFTYGIQVKQTLEDVQSLLNIGADLILGNHDQMYLDLINGNLDYYFKLPDWIKESIDYNLSKLDVKSFINLKWNKKIIYNNILYSHANPYDDWRYLNTDLEIQEAANFIKDNNFKCGVFGHNHRSMCYSLQQNKKIDCIVDSSTDDIYILNPGSLGQPRSQPPISTLLELFIEGNKISADIIPVIYNIQHQLDSISKSSLSDFTKSKLISFFKG